jgi:hypothetical protein
LDRGGFDDAAAALGREDIDALLYAMGRSIGPPWQAKHKLAAAAALAATGTPGRGRMPDNNPLQRTCDCNSRAAMGNWLP